MNETALEPCEHIWYQNLSGRVFCMMCDVRMPREPNGDKS